MAKRRRANARRTITRIEEAAEREAFRIAEEIVAEIKLNAPVGTEAKPEHLRLRNSYYVERDPVTGDALIKSRRRYWVFVEYGTGHGPEQQHVRPAIETVRARHT